MNIKKLFKYTPPSIYNFTIKHQTVIDNEFQDNEKNEDKKIHSSINQNLNYIENLYSISINSDIKIRQFSLTIDNKNYNSFICYIDGMVDSNLISDFVLKPLMIKHDNSIFLNNNKLNYEKKIENENLSNYIYNNLVPENNVSIETSFSKLILGINSGNCALFVDKINTGFNIDVKGFKQRNINTPNNEMIIKGPQEAFVENIRTNTSQLRRIINNENLIIENIEIGKINRTICALCYMKNITNTSLVNEARYRLNKLSIDTLLSSGQLEQLIQDSPEHGIPELLSTERPDKCAKALMQGRIVILINGNPYAIIAPAVLIDFLSSPEDENKKPLFANFLRFIRIIAMFITLLLPGLYIAITSFHQELLPTELLFSILVARESVPFPIILELLIMELSFELIREGGLRVPSAIGATLGIVGALILGEAAVNANIVSPILIIVVAITGLASFAIPDFSFEFHLRIYRFAFTFLGFTAGFLGIGLGLLVYMCLITNIKSFGIPYTSPLSSSVSPKGHGFLMLPYWRQEYREGYVAPKKIKSQDKISMKWRK